MSCLLASWRCLIGLAGGSPAATHFLYFAKESKQRKATPAVRDPFASLRGTLRCSPQAVSAQIVLLTPNPHPSPPRSGWACDEWQKRDQGRALFERNEVKRVCADPRFCRSSQVARSAAKGPGQPGRLFFGDFLLAKQKKVTCRRATPGQQAHPRPASTVAAVIQLFLSIRGYKC